MYSYFSATSPTFGSCFVVDFVNHFAGGWSEDTGWIKVPVISAHILGQTLKFGPKLGLTPHQNEKSEKEMIWCKI